MSYADFQAYLTSAVKGRTISVEKDIVPQIKVSNSFHSCQ